MFLKGMREPLNLTSSEAAELEKLWLDDEVEPSTKLQIEGVWTGTKSDIKFFKTEREDNPHHEKKVEPMTAKQAELFEEDILPAQLLAEASGLGTYNWERFYAQQKGATRIRAYESSRASGVLLRETVINPEVYAAIQKEIAAYKNFKERQAFAEKKKLESLEKAGYVHD